MITNDAEKPEDTGNNSAGCQSQTAAGTLMHVPGTYAGQPAQDRLIHLAMDELQEARFGRQQAMWSAQTANDQNQKLVSALAEADRRTRGLLTENDEQDSVLRQRDAEITRLNLALGVAKNELEQINLDPTKRRIRQLLRRVYEMAPNRQFKVLMKLADGTKALPVLGVSSANGVTTLTVARKWP